MRLYVDELVSVWKRTAIDIDAQSLEEAVKKYKEDDYEYDRCEYIDDTETYLGKTDLLDSKFNFVLSEG